MLGPKLWSCYFKNIRFFFQISNCLQSYRQLEQIYYTNIILWLERQKVLFLEKKLFLNFKWLLILVKSLKNKDQHELFRNAYLKEHICVTTSILQKPLKEYLYPEGSTYLLVNRYWGSIYLLVNNYWGVHFYKEYLLTVTLDKIFGTKKRNRAKLVTIRNVWDLVSHDDWPLLLKFNSGRETSH